MPGSMASMSESTSRRGFFFAAAGGAAVALSGSGLRHAMAAARAAPRGVGADELAMDEDFWGEIQRAFHVDRSLINLNNGGVSPAPETAMESLRRYDEHSNHAPARTMWRELGPQEETVRRRLARTFGCDVEEVAITRNATESLDNLIFGLDLRPGDEILSTTQDYGTMLSAAQQRVDREGLVLRKLAPPTPAASQDDLFRLFADGISARTRVILVSHVVNITGQIFPVGRICRHARERGIEVIVDGAHSFGLFPCTRDELDCDYFGTSLHKWLNAPVGAGMLYVRRQKIERVWPLFGQGKRDDIRKFEGIGTHPASHRLAIADAIALHDSIGVERKASRLRYLRDRWCDRFAGDPRFSFHALRNDVDSCAIATVGVRGVATNDLYKELWSRGRVVVSPIGHAGVDGIRVTPGIYTTVEEIDVFADLLGEIVGNV